MKLALSNIAWTLEEDALVAEVMGQAGISAVELAPTVMWPRPTEVTQEEALRYRDFWASRGISIVALQALLFGQPQLKVFGTAQERAATLAHLASLFQLARWLGAGPLVFGAPGNRRAGALPTEERDDLAVAFFREAAARATEHGVTLCLEPNPPQYGCDFITRASEAVVLAARVDRPGFGIHLDAAAMHLAGDDVAASIAAARPWLGHFHASEPQLLPLGEGGVDHRACAAALTAHGYSRCVSVEMRRRPDVDRRAELLRTAERVVSLYGGGVC